MRAAAQHALDAVAWLAQAGIHLAPEEARVFLDAALVLLPPELGLGLTLDAGEPPGEAQREALRTLWLRTGAPPPAPVPMPLQPMTPGVLGTAWRRLRESRAPRTEAG